MSLTYSEIKKQFDALNDTINYLEDNKNDLLNFINKCNTDKITFIGCGSSYLLSSSGAFAARMQAGLCSNSLAAGDLMLNYNNYKKSINDNIIISLSRSGSTSEVVNSFNILKEANVNFYSLNICCKKDTKVSEICDFSIELPWAFDESICQTRSVVNLFAASAIVCSYIGGNENLIKDLKSVAALGKNFIDSIEDNIKSIAQINWTNVVILADGEMEGLAAEGALAFTEIALVHGEFHHILDVRHGPMVLINNNTLVIICLNKNGYDYQKDLVLDLIKKGASVVTFADFDTPAIDGIKAHYIFPESLENSARGIPFVGIIQLLSYYKAIDKGVNPDKPEGLDAWIKL